MGAGPTQLAIENSGEATVAGTVHSALETFTDADVEAARHSMSCHRTQHSDEIVQRIFALQKRVWNGTLPLVPFFAADGGTDLLAPR